MARTLYRDAALADGTGPRPQVGVSLRVFTYDVDDRRFPGHRMEDPLKPIVATLLIRTAPEK